MWKPRTANFEGILYTAPRSLKENFGFVLMGASGCAQAIRGRKKKVDGKEITQLVAQTTFEGKATALVPFALLLCKHFSWTAANAANAASGTRKAFALCNHSLLQELQCVLRSPVV